MNPQSMFCAKIRKYQNFSSENFHFDNQNFFCILRGRVFIISSRLYFTISFSIGDNFNVLSPSTKIRHTKFTRYISI